MPLYFTPLCFMPLYSMPLYFMPLYFYATVLLYHCIVEVTGRHCYSVHASPEREDCLSVQKGKLFVFVSIILFMVMPTPTKRWRERRLRRAPAPLPHGVSENTWPGAGTIKLVKSARERLVPLPSNALEAGSECSGPQGSH